MKPATAPSDTAEVVGSFLERLGAQDADGVAQLFADDIEWFVPGSAALPWTGHRSRRPEVASYFTTMWPRFEPGKGSVEVEKILVFDEDAIILSIFTLTAASTGRSFTMPVAIHLVVTDGQITRLHLYEDTLAVSDAFFDQPH